MPLKIKAKESSPKVCIQVTIRKMSEERKKIYDK